MDEKLKLSMSTLSFQDWELERLLKVCRESGIEALELRLGLSEWSRQDMDQRECGSLMHKLSEYGLSISDLGTCVCVSGYRKDALEELERNMQLAERLGVKGLRIMFGNYRNRWSEDTAAPDYEGICRWIQEADRLAGENGREIWIETHYEFATGRMLEKLFADCGLKNCRVVWDVMHPLEQKESMEETLSCIGQYLVHVHIKDGSPWPDEDMASWKYQKVGEGSVPLRHFVKLLRAGGYTGYYSLEWESMWHDEIKGYDGEEIIRDYGAYMKAVFRERG